MASDETMSDEMQRRMRENWERQERIDAALADGSPMNCTRCGKSISAEEAAGNDGWCNDCSWGEYYHEP